VCSEEWKEENRRKVMLLLRRKKEERSSEVISSEKQKQLIHETRIDERSDDRECFHKKPLKHCNNCGRKF
jgi:hypothetical protein